MHREYNFENFEQLWRNLLRVRSSTQHLLDIGGEKRFREKWAGRINPQFLDHAESDIHSFRISAVILCWVWWSESVLKPRSARAARVISWLFKWPWSWFYCRLLQKEMGWCQGGVLPWPLPWPCSARYVFNMGAKGLLLDKIRELRVGIWLY